MRSEHSPALETACTAGMRLSRGNCLFTRTRSSPQRHQNGKYLGKCLSDSILDAVSLRITLSLCLQVDDAWRCVIADYGFARKANKSSAMTICGTDEFMAPEVLFGEVYDEKAVRGK
jgi:serine/threonine protein kinase